MMFLDHPKTGKQIMSLQEVQEIMVSRLPLGYTFQRQSPVSPACPLSYSSQLSTGVTMDMYIIYCKLMRSGYIVQRCVAAASKVFFCPSRCSHRSSRPF
jgi:hypothetical protein